MRDYALNFWWFLCVCGFHLRLGCGCIFNKIFVFVFVRLFTDVSFSFEKKFIFLCFSVFIILYVKLCIFLDNMSWWVHLLLFSAFLESWVSSVCPTCRLCVRMTCCCVSE